MREWTIFAIYVLLFPFVQSHHSFCAPTIHVRASYISFHHTRLVLLSHFRKRKMRLRRLESFAWGYEAGMWQSHPWNSLRILKALWARILQACFLKEKATGHPRRKAFASFLGSGSVFFSPLYRVSWDSSASYDWRWERSSENQDLV